MSLPQALSNLRLPLIGSPLFIISNPDLVIAQCKAGIVGSFPALNAREKAGEPIELERWLTRINEELDRHNQDNPDTPAAPYAVNQIVHKSNVRLERDVEICMKHKVPVWITSLGARPEVNEAAHAGGGIVLHDVINDRFAHKAIEKGADGLIAVAAGAGGHAGAQSPSRWFRKSAPGSTARCSCRAPLPAATACWPRWPWAPTAATQGPPSSPPRRPTRPRPTSR